MAEETTTVTAAATASTALEEAVKSNKVENNKIEVQKNRIQVSNTKKPLFFYLNLAKFIAYMIWIVGIHGIFVSSCGFDKRYIKQHDDVELSALGMAIPTVVIIAEILKRNGLATEKKVLTSTVGSKDEAKGRLVQKAKNNSATAPKKNADNIEIVVTPTPNGTAVAEPKKNADKE
ncbi:hypothetical protein LguiB_025791 [Lonicera macranthoides]